VLHLDDLTDPRSSDIVPAAVAAEQQATDGWTDLMQLAADFPLESLSFGSVADLTFGDVLTVVLPKPRNVSSQLSSNRLADLVDSAGDGPLIGLGAGMSLAGH
jgi:hypothetical protein